MIIFNLTKKNLSTKKKNFFFFKQKTIFKQNICNILLLNYVLSTSCLINKVNLKEKQVYDNFYTELNSISVVLNNNNLKIKDFIKNFSPYFKIKKSSISNTKLKKNLISFLSLGNEFKSDLILLTLFYNLNNVQNNFKNVDFFEQYYFKPIRSLISYNYKDFKFYKIFNSNFFFQKNQLQKVEYYFFYKTLSLEYFTILSLNDFLNSFKVLFILNNYKTLLQKN